MYYLVCPEKPVNNVCSDGYWLEVQEHNYLSSSDFLLILPQVVTALLFALAFRWAVRMIFNTR